MFKKKNHHFKHLNGREMQVFEIWQPIQLKNQFSSKLLFVFFFNRICMRCSDQLKKLKTVFDTA